MARSGQSLSTRTCGRRARTGALTVNSNHLANDPTRNPGRPRKKRTGEVGGNAAKAPKNRCSRCNEKGHSARSCSRLM